MDELALKDGGLDLALSEQARLQSLEIIIEKGMRTFVDVGNALLEIREERLYRASHSTFEAYCRERWGISKAYAHRTIGAVSVFDNLAPIGANTPSTESQARPLVSLPPEQQREAWTEATERAAAESRPVTARDVIEAVDKIKPHVAQNSGENEWYTPPEYIEVARIVLGGKIDLDPASTKIANEIVKAEIFYSKDNDGLNRQWGGNVWMNPPYASELIQKFTSKFTFHVLEGSIKTGIVLVNNATETLWFRSLVDCASAIVFTSGRVRFLDPQGNPGAPLQGQALIYFGDNPRFFISEFHKLGWGAIIQNGR